MIKQTQGYIRQ